MSARRHPLLLPVLIALTLIAALGSLTLGAVPLAPDRILAVLSGGGDEVARAILIDLRLPRMLLGLIVGAMLGLAGAALQGYLRNPLAEPSVLGASNAAALTLILAGIAVATLAGAGISLSLNLSPNPFAAMEIMSWLMGSLENRSYAHVWIALPCVLVGAALLIADGRSLDALTLGEEGAQALGVDLTKARLRMMLGVAIGVGGAVAVSGAIGFVGLIVPHLVRPLTDRSPSAILLPSLLGGAALLTLADIGVRLIPTSSELKLGVLTALLGVPVFLVHLMRERRLW